MLLILRCPVSSTVEKLEALPQAKALKWRPI